jgi:paraquat-inducible protein B
MGSKANPAVIGAFVVGAIALAVIGLLVFGSGQLFKKTTRIVCFFSGDTMGLNVGAPVKFKGVEVGSVTSIRIRIAEQAGQQLTAERIAQGIRIPVIIEIDNEKLTTEGTKPLDRAWLKQLIDLGLRAQLVSQSMVTGLLLVQLDFHPDTPEVFVLPPDSKQPEIPTIPPSLQQIKSAAEEILQKLNKMKFEELVQSAKEAVDGIKDLVRSPDLERAVARLPETVKNVNDAVRDLRALTGNIDQRQGPLMQNLTRTSDSTAATMEQAKQTLERLQTLVGPNAPLTVDLATSLRELAGAARSVRLLAEYLERHPSAVVRGRPEREE